MVRVDKKNGGNTMFNPSAGRLNHRHLDSLTVTSPLNELKLAGAGTAAYGFRSFKNYRIRVRMVCC